MPILLLLLLLFPPSASAEPLGELSANPFDSASTSNPFGTSSPFSNQSTINPYATDAPRLYDQQRNYRGNLSANPYDPDSVKNPYGCYGSSHSSESLNNLYGAGNPYRLDSPPIRTAQAGASNGDSLPVWG